MSLKRLLLSKIDSLFGAHAEEDRQKAHESLRRIVEVTLPELRPIALRWETDPKDPDVSNARDRLNAKLWQIEDLDTLMVVRVFDANREMILKQRLAPTKDLPFQIEAVREMIYNTGATLDRAFDHYVMDSQRDAAEAEKPAKMERLILTNPISPSQTEEPEVLDLGH